MLFFIIYSCKHKLSFAENIYKALYGRLQNDTKIYITYGDDQIDGEYKLLDDKYLVLNTGDYYEDLSQKTLKFIDVLSKYFPECDGCFKCDDDIVPNIESINRHINIFMANDQIKYAGCCGNYNKDGKDTYNFTCHYNKVNDPSYNRPMYSPNSHYCPGPLYYINRECINAISHSEKTNFIIAEDICVGYYLNQANIFPTYVKLYTDYPNEINTISFQNIQNRYNINWNQT